MKNRKTLFSAALIFALVFLIFPAFRGEKPTKLVEKITSSHQEKSIFKLSEKLQRRLLAASGKESFNLWVYFKDKGPVSRSPLSLKKNLRLVRQSLSPHSIWRRSKVRQESSLVDSLDLPLFTPYTEEVKSRVLKVRTVSRWFNAMSVKATASQAFAVSRLPFVRKIDLVATFHRKKQPASPVPPAAEAEKADFPLNYGKSFAQLDQINVIPLHRLGYSGQGVRVCLLDTGFRKSHEAFKQAHLLAEWDFVNGDGDVSYDPLDPDDYSDSHGTGTWSILGGYMPGEIIGPAYGADFILAKTETTRFEDQIEEDFWVAGIEWAESLGAEVVSSSLGYTDWYTFNDLDGQTAVTTIAANRAVELGVVVVNAAGNSRNDAWGHIIAPADGFKVIAVGAVDAEGKIASFSSPGPTADGRIKPEVCARGVGNWLASNLEDGRDYYRSGDGTSFSTPLVAGVAALILEAHRDWTPAQVYEVLKSTASRSENPDNDYGWGIVNAFLAAGVDFAFLKLDGYELDDDSSGESSGNGNGVAEPGETLELFLTLRNESSITATTPRIELSSPHPQVDILRAEMDYPSIPPSGRERGQLPFTFSIPAYFKGHHLILHVSIQGPNIIAKTERLRIPVPHY